MNEAHTTVDSISKLLNSQPKSNINNNFDNNEMDIDNDDELYD